MGQCGLHRETGSFYHLHPHFLEEMTQQKYHLASSTLSKETAHIIRGISEEKQLSGAIKNKR